MIAQALEDRIDETIPLVEAIYRTGVENPCPIKDIPACSMPRGEFDFLYALVKKFGGPVLEQGSYAGGSTRAIHQALEENGKGQLVFAVDVYHRIDNPDAWPLRVGVTANSRGYVPPYKCFLGFEDADHTRITTRENLERQKEAGCQIIAIHDVDPVKLLDAPMSMEHTSRAGALEFFAENPEYFLIEVKCTQGMFVGVKRPLEF